MVLLIPVIQQAHRSHTGIQNQNPAMPIINAITASGTAHRSDFCAL